MTAARRLAALAALLLAGLNTPLQAQATVQGRVIDAAGKPVAGQVVLLHRVVGAGGANIAQATTGEDGRFRVEADSVSPPDAVYFLAARWNGELYIGEAFRAPIGTGDHLLQVGVPGTSASALLEGNGPASAGPAAAPARSGGGSPATGTSWLLFAVPGIALLGVVAYFILRSRPTISAHRRLLAEIAQLDLQQGVNASEEYRALRAQLLERLRQTSP